MEEQSMVERALPTNITVLASLSRRHYYCTTPRPVAALRVCKRCAAPGPMGRGGPSKPQNY